jgi:hypothetical protein
MTKQQRRYEATGVDDLGDVHTFGSDDRQRAEDVAELIREDLDQVELVENAGNGSSGA